MSAKFYCWFAVFLLLLTACQTSPDMKSGSDLTTVIERLPAELSGDYQQAATEYLKLAENEQGRRQAVYYLRAANMYWQTSQAVESEKTFGKVDRSLLNTDEQFSAGMLAANIALFNSNASQAAAELESININNLSRQQLQKLLTLQADVYTLTENWQSKAETHLSLEELLTDQAELEVNREGLWTALMNMTPQALDLYNPGVPPAEDSGWYSLAYALKAYQDNPVATKVALENWQLSYPNHPADASLYQNLIAKVATLPDEINKIAVLLPDSGPFVRVANVIKQAISAAYYTDNKKADIQFYSINDAAESGFTNVIEQYQLAVTEGADIVLGPLQKDAVAQLAANESLPIPVLALNKIEGEVNSPNLYQFSLSPEDDAKNMMRYAQEMGYQRSLVLTPNNSWGRRIDKQLATDWQNFNGTVLRSTYYENVENDFAATLKPLLGLAASQQRHQRLQSLLARNMEFEPRRRQDIDCLFLAATPTKARQIVPALKFHHAGDLPVIASSHAYSGSPNPQQDIDLNRLTIVDIPWLLSEDAKQDPAYQALSSQSTNFKALVRFYAFGVDAYRLLPHLNLFTETPESTIIGATGELSLNDKGQIERRMWHGQFIKGSLVRIE